MVVDPPPPSPRRYQRSIVAMVRADVYAVLECEAKTRGLTPGQLAGEILAAQTDIPVPPARPLPPPRDPDAEPAPRFELRPIFHAQPALPTRTYIEIPDGAVIPLGSEIKKQREALNLAQNDLATMAGVSRGGVARVESLGDRDMSRGMRWKLSQVLKAVGPR